MQRSLAVVVVDVTMQTQAKPDVGLTRGDLGRNAMVASALAFAGIPLYIHAPQYFAEEMGLGLGALGAALLGARIVDSVQDPVLGWLADRIKGQREMWAAIASTLLIIGFGILFTTPTWGDPLVRLIAGLLLAFTGFSALQIVLYDHGVAIARTGGDAHTRVALWREVGGICGICLAALTPPLLTTAFGAPLAYTGYAIVFGVVMVLAAVFMTGHWQRSGIATTGSSIGDALRAPGVLAVLVFGFINALPTAITATLFLFFVSEVLVAEAHAGPLLLIFFAGAGAAAPLWAKLADRAGRRRTLALAMALAIGAFIWAWTLGEGDVGAFYVISLTSGAALGADMTLGPAMLAARIKDGAPRVFALWTFLQKLALALAAGAVLPWLALAGFDPALPVTDEGRAALITAYALIPCALKVLAIAALTLIPKDEERSL